MIESEIERVTDIVRGGRYKRIALQLPEGLKEKAPTIAASLKKLGCDVYILGDPCYGACDLADYEASALGCEALLHFGHSPLKGKPLLPVHYIEVRMDFDVLPIIEKNLKTLPRKLGLITTVQHAHMIDELKQYLEEIGFEIHVGGGLGRASYPGQVLGCSFKGARDISGAVDAFVYVGSGLFHPLGVSLSTGRKVYVLNHQRGALEDIDELKESILRRRFAVITKAESAKSFGILMGLKKGQMRKGLALKINKMLEKHGKEGYLICLRELNPDALLPFRKLDAFVNTACPRVAIDDAQRYKKPVLTPAELEIVLGVREWEDYSMDEMD